MATVWYTMQLVLPRDTGLPADSITNTWHYIGSDAVADGVNALDFDTQLDAFYTSWVPGFGSTDYDWANCVTKHYTMLDPRPRLPFYTGTISPGTPPSSQSDWPAEVAVVLSMEGERESGTNMRRRRGRVYLGPLSRSAGDAPMLGNAEADVFANGADAAFFGTSLTDLAVYSPYTHHGVPVGENIKDYPDEIPDALPASFTEVQRIWVDTAWDTQRRRGPKATYRKTIDK